MCFEKLSRQLWIGLAPCGSHDLAYEEAHHGLLTIQVFLDGARVLRQNIRHDVVELILIADTTQPPLLDDLGCCLPRLEHDRQ